MLFFSAGNCMAETRYISDILIINIRDNIERPFRVVTTVQSNDPVTILEEQGKYLRVKTEDGHSGWISAQYVKTQIPKSIIVQNLQAELEKLKSAQRASGLLEFEQLADFASMPSAEEYSQLQAERDALIAEIEALQTRLEHSTSEPKDTEDTTHSELQENYEYLLEDQTAMTETNRILQEERTNLQSPLLAQIAEKESLVSELTRENEQLKKKQGIYWFCTGATVFLAGLLAGKVFGRRKTRYGY